MPLHKEVPSLQKIAAKKVAILVIDSVKHIRKEYGDYEKQACVEKAFELQQFLRDKYGSLVHEVNNAIQIEAKHQSVVAASCKVLCAVLIRSDMKVFNIMFLVFMCTGDMDSFNSLLLVRDHLFGDITFWKTRLEQCYRLVELNVTGLSPEFVAKCNYFEVITNNCKHTLEIVSFSFHSCKETFPLLNNFQKCKELTTVSFIGDVQYYEVISEYVKCVKMFVESLPKLSTFSLPGMHYVLQKYEELYIVGFSSTSLTDFGKFSFPWETVTSHKLLLLKLFDLCPNIDQISIHSAFSHVLGRQHAHVYVNYDAHIMKCLNSSRLHLKSLSIILFSDNVSYNIALLTLIGSSLRTLKVEVCVMTSSDFLVIGQVCHNLETLSLVVNEFALSKPSKMDQAGTCVIFTKLTSLSLQSHNADLIFHSGVNLEQYSMLGNVLRLVLKNARKLEKLELDLDSSFDSIFCEIVPFFLDETLKNLTYFSFRGSSRRSPLTKDTIRLILDKCPKLSVLKLMTGMTADAKEYVKELFHQTTFNNFALEIQV